MKYLDINLIKYVQRLVYLKKVKLWEVKEELNKEQIMPTDGKSHIVKMSIVPKFIYRFNTILNKTS